MASRRPVFFRDAQGRYLGCNRAYEEYRGVKREQLIGRPMHAGISKDQADVYAAADAALIESPGVQRYESSVVYADGTPHEVVVYKATFFRTDGSTGGVVGVMLDISDRKAAEAQIRHLNAELEARVVERTAQLVAANQELEAFSYSVSHDLRAPLRSIEGFSHVLMEEYRERLDETGQGYLQRVRANSQRMGSLIDDMLKLSRLARSEMHREPVNLAQLAHLPQRQIDRPAGREEAAGRLGALFGRVVVEQRGKLVEARQIGLGVPGIVDRVGGVEEVGVSIAPSLLVEADANFMRIALENLIGNAWKFTGKKAQARIDVGAAEENGEPVYFVRDNGVGFDMSYVHKLFVPFERLHDLSEFEGTGIGLTIVRRVINRHGGRVWAESKVGEGTTIYFTLGKAI